MSDSGTRKRSAKLVEKVPERKKGEIIFMLLRNWRLEELLLSRKRGSLKVVPWPDVKQCQVLKNFIHRGRELFAFDSFKHIDADVIELEAAEARQLQSQALVSAVPAADRFKCGPEGIAGWRPWFKNYGAPTHDWEGRGGLDVFDDCFIRIAYIGSIGATQLCPGLLLSAADQPIYFPFGAIRAFGRYHCEDDPEQFGVIRIYLDELAANPAGEVTP
jgi:hypothetical protein